MHTQKKSESGVKAAVTPSMAHILSSLYTEKKIALFAVLKNSIWHYDVCRNPVKTKTK